jgi:heme oxygenase
MVNAKLGITMSDDSVWAEGLLVFYEIFKFLEEALERHKDSLIGDLLIPGMERTMSFEQDLSHYLGKQWKTDYVIRPEVQNYLKHLRDLEDKEPYLLVAYVYHLYMGLFSGGQVLRAKKMISLSALSSVGNSVTEYEKVSIGSLKKQLKGAINQFADNIDVQLRQEILEEGINVFKMNNTIIASVKGVDAVLKRKLLKLLMVMILMFLLTMLTWNYFSVESDSSAMSDEKEKLSI